jgi:C1A family cysteine protease
VNSGGTCIHGITKFADMTQAEFEQYLLGWKVDMENVNGNIPVYRVDSVELNENVDKSTTSADWVGIYTTPIKNQGYCGSCWAFSATEQMESNAIMSGILNTTSELSPQQIVSW